MLTYELNISEMLIQNLIVEACNIAGGLCENVGQADECVPVWHEYSN